MTFLIIEHFNPLRVREMYERFAQDGRRLPEGVSYINSWINEEVTFCFQVMEAPSVASIQDWAKQWQGFAEFEIISVIDSDEARRRVMSPERPV